MKHLLICAAVVLFTPIAQLVDCYNLHTPIPRYYISDGPLEADSQIIDLWMDVLQGMHFNTSYYGDEIGFNFSGNATTTPSFNPNLPLFPCTLIDYSFFRCYFFLEAAKNGCTHYGSNYIEDGPESSFIVCEVLPGIECLGDRFFFIEDVACAKYDHYEFTNALLYAMFLGFFGIDRFYLRHYIAGIIKACTLGGVGIWWITDIVLLVMGYLRPYDEYSFARFTY